MAPPKRPWLRLYSEILWDFKVRGLKPEHRWLWIAALALARSSCIPGFLLVSERSPMTAEQIADAAALPVRQVRSGLQALEEAGLIEKDLNINAWSIPKWNERQFESDETSKRTAKHRRRNVPSGVDVTPPETETETDSEVTPPTPPPGGLRSEGQNPRAVAARRERDRIVALIDGCSTCGDNPAFWCEICTGLRRKLSEVSA